MCLYELTHVFTKRNYRKLIPAALTIYYSIFSSDIGGIFHEKRSCFNFLLRKHFSILSFLISVELY